jgi:hypothetical protein
MNDKTGQGQPPSKKAPTNRWVRLGFLVVALGVATLIYLRQRSGPALEDWKEDLDAALREAADSNRPILVFFMSDPPGSEAEDLNKRIFGKDENVKAVKNGGFIQVKAKLKPQDPRLSQYRIRLEDLPLLMILSAQGKEIKRRDKSIGEVPFRSEFLDCSKP